MNAIAVQIFDILKMTIILDNEHGAIKSQVERWNSSQDTPEYHLSFWKKKETHKYFKATSDYWHYISQSA